jgi:hypothetical protein
VFIVEQGGYPLHFTGEGGSDFQFAKNHRAGLSAAPRCHRVVVEYGFHASQTETKWDALSRIFLESGCAGGISFKKKMP